MGVKRWVTDSASSRDPERLSRRQARCLGQLLAGVDHQAIHGSTLRSLESRGLVWMAPTGPYLTEEGRAVLGRYVLGVTAGSAEELAEALADDMASLRDELAQLRRRL